MIERFESASETRVHCSPPSVAVLRAAERGLQLNRQCGDQLRAKLATLVTRFRNELRNIGLTTDGGLFPVQTISTFTGGDTLELHKYLSDRGIRTVLHRSRKKDRMKLSFLINASHSPGEIDFAVHALNEKVACDQERVTRFEVNHGIQQR